MKQTTKVFAIFFIMAAFAFTPPIHNIVGHWMISYPNGYKNYLDLEQDGTFRSFDSTGKTIHQGNYKYNDETFSINDKDGCGYTDSTYWATYKFTFYGEDSASFTAIEDACTPRKEAIDGGGLKRLKNE